VHQAGPRPISRRASFDLHPQRAQAACLREPRACLRVCASGINAAISFLVASISSSVSALSGLNCTAIVVSSKSRGLYVVMSHYPQTPNVHEVAWINHNLGLAFAARRRVAADLCAKSVIRASTIAQSRYIRLHIAYVRLDDAHPSQGTRGHDKIQP
jgi:hypothetical protein